MLAGPASRLFGLGPSITFALLLDGAAVLLIPLANGPLSAALPLLFLAYTLYGLALPVYNINLMSLRQAATPHHLQGRVNATIRFVVWGAIPLGALTGGFLADHLGVRLTMVVGAAGALLSFLWVICSPLRRMQQPPAVSG